MNPIFRHELKCLISTGQYIEIRQVLKQILHLDANTGEDTEYNIRSLYFDDLYHTAYQEKEDGISIRKKYRIRIYKWQDRVITLECKFKNDRYVRKESLRISRESYERILTGNVGFLLSNDAPIAREFFLDTKERLLRPRVIVEYDREPYVFETGTVRITFDRHLCAIPKEEDMFDGYAQRISVLPEDQMILEIKYTGLLPGGIRHIIKSYGLQVVSSSKYCMCIDKLMEANLIL